MPSPIWKSKKSIFKTFGSPLSQISVYCRHNVFKSTISRLVENFNVTGTVSDHLRTSASHVRRVSKVYMIRQRHLRDGFLKAQGRSAFAIVNPQ